MKAKGKKRENIRKQNKSDKIDHPKYKYHQFCTLHKSYIEAHTDAGKQACQGLQDAQKQVSQQLKDADNLQTNHVTKSTMLKSQCNLVKQITFCTSQQ